MNNLPVLFEGNEDVRFHEINEEFCMTAEDIGKGLGYSDPANSINRLYERNREELEPYQYSVNLTENPLGGRPARVFNEEGIYIISLLANTPIAKEFRKKVARLLKELRHQRLAQARADAAFSALRLQERVESAGKDNKFLKSVVRYRRDAGLTQRETGKLLDCHKKTVQRYEKLLHETGLWENMN